MRRGRWIRSVKVVRFLRDFRVEKIETEEEVVDSKDFKSKEEAYAYAAKIGAEWEDDGFLKQDRRRDV